jgi:hypothetical protein
MASENLTLPRRGFRAVTLAAVVIATAAIVLVPIAPASSTPVSAVAWAAAADGEIGIRLLDVPQDSLDDPRARQYIVDELLPGTTIQRRIEISNTTNAAVTIQAYAAAANITDGSFVGADARTANELSSWTSLSEAEVLVPANSTAVDTVTVAVPADAPPGEQYAAVWVEASSPNGTVQLVNRVGIRMYVSIGGDNAASNSFTIDSMTAARDADGNAVVTARLHNTGGRALDVAADLTLAGMTGSLTAGPYPADLGTTIAPGTTGDLAVFIGDPIAAGPWKATIVATSGTLSQTSEAELTFPETGSADTVAATAETGLPLWLLLLLVAVALLLITAAVLITLAMRRRGLSLR